MPTTTPDPISPTPVSTPGSTILTEPFSPCLSTISSSSSNDPDMFTLTQSWRPSVMNAISGKDEHEQRKQLTPDVRNAIVRDLITTMYAYMSKFNKSFCTKVAKALVKKYSFMKDVGTGVSGYVSFALFIACHKWNK